MDARKATTALVVLLTLASPLTAAVEAHATNGPEATSCVAMREVNPGITKVPATCAAVGDRFKWDVHDVPVPDAGSGVTSVAVLAGEGQSELSIASHAGQLEITRRASANNTEGTAVATASPSACSDSANNWTGNRNNGWTYRIDATSPPSGVTSSDFISEIASAETALETGYNDCGKAQGSGLFSLEMSRGPDVVAEAMTSTGGCLKDNVRIVDFGGLTSPAIGQACLWWSWNPVGDNSIYEADVRLLRSSIWFRYIPAGCSGKFEMAGVLTHEFGHVFGFGHVSESTHANLTMSETSTPSSYADRSLGLGDYNMLNSHY